jgi:hypothetical protein
MSKSDEELVIGAQSLENTEEDIGKKLTQNYLD